MESIKRYIRKSQRSGATIKEKAVNEGRRNFTKILNENPTSFEIQATIPDEVCITSNTRYIMALITDVTLNDQRALDDKYIHVDFEENIDVGCYVKWQGINWLLVYQEVNGFPTHKTFVMKRCNQIFRFKQDDVIYDIPVSVTNLTLYSDGLADGKFLSRADAKRNIKFGSSPVTRNIDLGYRIMLTNKTVFRFTHIDSFSHEGLISSIGLQTAIVPLDDIENNIAYNPSTEDIEKEEPVSVSSISGEAYLYLGTEEVYSIDSSSVKWSLSDDVCTVRSDGNGVCTISAPKDSKYIGHVVTLYAKYNGTTLMKDIIIKGYF